MAYLTLLDKLLLYNLLFLCLVVVEVVVAVSVGADVSYCFTGEGVARTRLDIALSAAIAGTWVRARALGLAGGRGAHPVA